MKPAKTKLFAAALACAALLVGCGGSQTQDQSQASATAGGQDAGKVYRGFKVEYKHQPWDSLFAALGNGDVDILASAVTITDERKQAMDFSDPYYKITQVILVPQGKNIKSAEDLKNVNKVGVVTGNTGDLAAGKILGADSSKIARFENITLVTKELENGGLDAVISDSAVVANYVKNNEGKGFTMVSVPDFDEENYGFAVRKGDTQTQAMLNDALKKVRESGEYDRISAKYFAK